MSICIPKDNCGVDANYQIRGITFVISASNALKCIKSRHDYIPGELAWDCSNDLDGCDTNL